MILSFLLKKLKNKPDYEVLLSELREEITRDLEKANAKYEGKFLKITGTQRETMAIDKEYVLFGLMDRPKDAKAPALFTECKLPYSQNEKAMALDFGAIAVLYGIYGKTIRDSNGNFELTLDKCNLDK
ncbi:hypothetical protein [Leptospira sp. 'Mane']|uniref:hypothetical protein n=1 Tax=Leptospira sp. 'Mane' TaxID=3387407 RepID=UPI00398B9966